MANIRTLQKSFNGGEVTPEFFGRIDDASYQSGTAQMRNFIALPHGPTVNRPGTAFVRAVKNATTRTRLIPFSYSITQTFVIELGAGYFRFHTQGSTLMNGAVPYEVANLYVEADLFDIHYVQSADVLTLVHPKHPPRELRRLGALNWQLVDITFRSTLNPPATVTATATRAAAPNTLQDYSYRVTTIGSNGREESQASSIAITNISNNLFQSGAFNTLTWSMAQGALRYNVYKYSNGMYGYIGQTSGYTFKDDNITADLSRTPPENYNPFPTIGQILSVPVLTGGANYGGRGIASVAITPYTSTSTSPTASITVTDATGTGAALTPIVKLTDAVNMIYTVTGVTISNAGSNYTAPVISCSDPSCVITATLGALGVPALAVSANGGAGLNATVEAVVTGGVITGVKVVNPGFGYTAPTITIVNALGGTGATFGAPVLSDGKDFPSAVSYFEQRRVFAASINQSQSVWMSKSATESDMSYSLPTRDNDSISFKVAAREANSIRHIVPLNNLVLLSSSGEWQVTGSNQGAITPASVSVRQQSAIGANNVPPLIINNSLLYIAARGGHIRELGYSWQANGYLTNDISLRCPHLFDGLDIVDAAYSKSPQPLCWFVSSNGKLLGLTYVPEQHIGAWHQHDTDGLFESCCVIAEGNEDVLYVVVNRTVNGTPVRYVERLATRQLSTPADAFFVDCGLSYSGTPATVITGLAHLEGKTVNILCDGDVHPQRVVTSGQVTLDYPVSKAQIGLPIMAELKTLPLAMQLDGSFGQGHAKAINKAWLRVYRSGGIFISAGSGKTVEAKLRTTEPYGSPIALKSEELEIMIPSSWSSGGQVLIQQRDPLPLTIVSLTLEVAIGG